MTSFGSLLALIGLAVAAEPSVPAGLDLRVRAEVARHWDVDAASVRLEWSRIVRPVDIADTAPFRLVGQGTDGRFVVLIAHPPGEIAISVRAGREVRQWIATRPLRLGVTVGPGDVRVDRRLVFGPPRGEDRSPLGWEVHRSLGPGDPVAPPAVREPPVIRPGDPVRFEWRLGGMMVAREGLAATAARRGERVWARDPVRGERIEGIATGPGQARLGKGG